MRSQIARTLGISVLASSMALSFSVSAAEGLYSADEIMDADVYDSTGEEVGEVEDVLLGDDMSVHSLVLKTGAVMGMGGKDVVAERGTFTVRLEQDDDDDGFDDLDYEVHMEATQDEIKALPEYDESWWNQTSNSLSQAWENTKEGSRNAWENTKEASSSAWQNMKDGAGDMADDTQDAFNN